MKNREKYRDIILEDRGLISDNTENICRSLIQPIVLASFNKKCSGLNCRQCYLLQSLWLDEEYVESEKDKVYWRKVEVDTPTLVKKCRDGVWQRCHFAKYENGKVYCFPDGQTSHSVEYGSHTVPWAYAKLAVKDDK